MRERIRNAVFRAIDELNLQRPKSDHLAKSEDATLAGLDSLGMANFVVLTEQEIEKEFDRSVNLLEEGSLLDDSAGPKNISALIGIIERILAQGPDD